MKRDTFGVFLVTLYLVAIVLANVIVTTFGPGVSIATAFLFIGLDITARDYLHERWYGTFLWPKMALLIGTGGMLSLLFGGSQEIAVASSLAFIASGLLDTYVYHNTIQFSRFTRVQLSNAFAATVDTLVFVIAAFGFPILWGVVIGQIIVKILGGFFWTFLLHKPRFHYT